MHTFNRTIRGLFFILLPAPVLSPTFAGDAKNQIPLKSYVNGSSQPPRVGDLLIYARAFYGTGHVAVVTAVDLKKGVIKVAEQNYNNKPWPGDYARSVELYKKSKHYWLLDAYILGWKHAES